MSQEVKRLRALKMWLGIDGGIVVVESLGFAEDGCDDGLWLSNGCWFDRGGCTSWVFACENMESLSARTAACLLTTTRGLFCVS